MYTKFFGYFGLRTNPFHTAAKSDCLFLSQRAQSALDGMADAIQARKGLIVLTGEVGTGKTTLLNELKQWLADQKTPTAFIFNPYIEASDLFDLILANLGVAATASNGAKPLDRLHRWLMEQYQGGKNAVVILDEAQGLPVHMLLEISMLLNHEMEGEKLLQVVLSGEPELEATLKRPELRQIRQRICLRCQTTAFTRQETHEYVCQRLHVAGGIPENVMAPEAIDAIYLHSGGIPRVMNLLCEQSMIQAFLKQTKPVPCSVVDEVARQLQFDAVPVANSSIWDSAPPVISAGTLPRTWSGSSRLIPFADEKKVVSQAPITQVPEGAARRAYVTADAEQGQAPVIPIGPSISHVSSPKAAPPPTPIAKFEVDNSLLRELQARVNEGPVAAKGSQPKVSIRPSKISGTRGWAHRRTSSSFASANLFREVRDWGRGIRTTLNPLAKSFPEQLRQIPTRFRVSEHKRDLALAIRKLNRTHWNVVSRKIWESWKGISTLASSTDWQGKLDSVVHWLQEPIPFMKINRRAGH
jgi:general secretion pathway protein A